MMIMDGDGGSALVLVGRSSSHFTRTARMFALELGVAHRFQPVLDIGSHDSATFAGNPALKVPIWLDEHGPLYGTENICRELARRSGQRDRAVLRGDVGDRLVANAEELVLHAMSSQVTLIMTATADASSPAPSKVRPSLNNALAFLDGQVDAVRAALPAQRLVSFVEIALYCLVRHLPFRQTMDPSGYQRLQAFCREIDARPAAQATSYRFDT
jgi:glutathione S-transferase